MKATKPRGRLIALDGVNNALLVRTARVLAREAGKGSGVSPWDASGIFTELAGGSPDLERPSPRTLTLLYAADLAFRLRWQIGPALAAGRTVVAAPYLATAVAVGAAAGLPPDWLQELFRFAPAPNDIRRAEGSRAGGKVRDGNTGYVDFFCRELKRAGRGPGTGELRRRALVYLDPRALPTASAT
jgi:hypothetical protein